MHKARFGSLWVGSQLPLLQKVCLSSFAHYGHEIYLYVYDDTIEVPPGVIKRNASEIIDESEIFLVENTYAGFSDLFRYRMIKKTGLAWVDADTICLSSEWDFKDGIFASLESGDHGSFVVGGVLGLPQDSEIIDYLIDESTKYDKTKMTWSEIGPVLVDRAFKKFNLMSYVHPQETFCGIKIHESEYMWRPDKLEYILSLQDKSKSISVYNQTATRNGYDKNIFPVGSPLDYFHNKFFNDNFSLFTKNYKPKIGDIVMDVGSGNGFELPLFSAEVGESGHVYAIEADPHLHQKSLDLVNSLGLKNVTCINIALMEKSGEVEIGIFSSGRLDNSIYTKGAKETVTVLSNTLDNLIEEYNIKQLDYIKINIEGAESNALLGITDLSKIKNWCISTHDFCGIKTKNLVVNFFNSKGIVVNIHDEVDGEPWKGGYVYVKTN
jgi:FkbM family methyltransferase